MNDAERYASDFEPVFRAVRGVRLCDCIGSDRPGRVRRDAPVFRAERRKEVRQRFDAELKEARQRFDDEVASQKREVESLRQQLADNADRQLKEAERATLAQSLLPFGEHQYHAQDFKGATDTFRRALAFDNRNPIIYYRLGYVYVQSGSA